MQSKIYYRILFILFSILLFSNLAKAQSYTFTFQATKQGYRKLSDEVKISYNQNDKTLRVTTQKDAISTAYWVQKTNLSKYTDKYFIEGEGGVFTIEKDEQGNPTKCVYQGYGMLIVYTNICDILLIADLKRF